MGRRGRHAGPYRVGEEDEDGRVTAAQAAANARLTRLEADPRLVAAARVAATFHLDPVAVLAETDPLRRDLRIAAHNRVQTEAAKANKRGGG